MSAIANDQELSCDNCTGGVGHDQHLWRLEAGFNCHERFESHERSEALHLCEDCVRSLHIFAAEGEIPRCDPED